MACSKIGRDNYLVSISPHISPEKDSSSFSRPMTSNLEIKNNKNRKPILL